MTARRFREPSSTEAIYLTTETQVVSRSCVRGQISEARFLEALNALEAHYVILRAAVQAGHFVERPTSSVTPVTWFSAASMDVVGLYERLLETKLDLGQSLYNVFVIRDRDRFDIFLLTSHAVTDATSLVELHAFLIHLCDRAVRGLAITVEEQPFPETIDDTVSQRLIQLGHDADAAPPASGYEGRFLQLPAAASTTETLSPRHRLHRLEIEASLMVAITAAAHACGVSLHCLLAAAYAQAVQSLSESQSTRILLRCSVDLRRRLEPHVSTELVFSAVTAHATMIEDVRQPLADIARCLHDDIQDSTRNGRIFLDYQNYPKAFGIPQDMPAALNISDMGHIRFHHPVEELQPLGFDYATGWLKPFPNISVTIHDDHLVANTAYTEAFIAPSTIADMAERFRENLVEAVDLLATA